MCVETRPFCSRSHSHMLMAPDSQVEELLQDKTPKIADILGGGKIPEECAGCIVSPRQGTELTKVLAAATSRSLKTRRNRKTVWIGAKSMNSHEWICEGQHTLTRLLLVGAFVAGLSLLVRRRSLEMLRLGCQV